MKQKFKHPEYRDKFTQLIIEQSPIILWQVTPDGKREVGYAGPRLYDEEQELLHLEFIQKISLSQTEPIYFFSEPVQFIFKTQLSSLEQNELKVKFPDAIKVLPESDVAVMKKQFRALSSGPDVMRVKSLGQRSSRDIDFFKKEFDLSLDEEDRIYADQRESPRIRPKVDKWVRVLLKDKAEVHTLKLFDLSRGGLGFICGRGDIFVNGVEVHVLGFDEFNLDDPLIGVIVSSRPADEEHREFKIGIKFLDA